MDVGRQEEQAHDLDDAGAGDVAEAGDLGHALDLAAVEHALEVMGKGKEAGDAWHGALRPRACRLHPPVLTHLYILRPLACPVR